ncbi:MAG: 50S ribosomal protein L11 [Planctomycetes bacterium]|jgi:large subunit ribosomal protein L11|nr:50S ribosomal protein L11 [Planctomycetota bacterium]MCL4730388.1 50S ribosomal protein L11 [Planctomycetota bacterium]
MEITAKVKLQCPGGQATPAPPVGPALGQHGVNIADFVKRFNDQTRDRMGMILPVEITIFKNRSFTFIIKSPPASVLIKTELKLQSGSKTPGRESVGKITKAQLEKIAKVKLNDLNAGSLEAATRVIAGTARSMGVKVEG